MCQSWIVWTGAFAASAGAAKRMLCLPEWATEVSGVPKDQASRWMKSASKASNSPDGKQFIGGPDQVGFVIPSLEGSIVTGTVELTTPFSSVTFPYTSIGRLT